ALLLLGLKAKPQVNQLGERKALEGDRVKIFVVWEQDGMKKRYRAEKLIWDRSTDKPMENVGWIFTGSRFLKIPIYVADQEEPEVREVFMATEKGSLVTTFHDPDSILDNPLEMGGDDTVYYANDRLLPPRGTPIEFIIQADVTEKKDSEAVDGDAEIPAPPPKKSEEGRK
ncbi:MAG: YdjY domain-containing protein, partial [Planctomycetota bacterium]|nr:YdjY domain-containing protein [Planctomycetota bacterium]